MYVMQSKRRNQPLPRLCASNQSRNSDLPTQLKQNFSKSDLEHLCAALQQNLGVTKNKHSSPQQATAIIYHNAQPYIVKYNRRRSMRYVQAVLISIGYALLFHSLVSPKRLRTGNIAHEARRLRYLHEHGIAVPQVLLETADFLIIEYCGASLEQILNQRPTHERHMLLNRAVDNLASLHRKQQWHGGAQLRNLTLSGTRIYRIDFEETAGDALPLSVIQAYDVILSLHSMIDFLDAGVMQGVALLQRYFQQAPCTRVATALYRVERLTGLLIALERLFGTRLRKSRDVSRSIALAQIMRAFHPQLLALMARAGSGAHQRH